MGKTPVAIAGPTIYIGYTGGWGGGQAFKLEGGELFESVKERALGGPAEITGEQAYRPLKSATGQAAMRALADRYTPNIFAGVAPKFDCPEAAYDGVCPYFIIIENGEPQAWTRSKDDKNAEFLRFMNEVEEALTKV